MGPVVTFRPALTRAVTLVVVVGAFVSLAAIAAAEPAAIIVRSAAAPVLVATATWILFWRPEVEISDGGIVLRNPFRIVRVPWPSLRGVDTTWALRLKTTDGAYSAWAAPSSLRSAGRSGERSGGRPIGRPEGDEAVVVTRGVTAEAVAREVVARWGAWRPRPGPGVRTRPEVTWRVATIAVLLCAVTWLQLAVVLP